MELPKLYTLEEVAAATGFALRTLERDCRAGRIAHVHRGRARMMTADQVEALIELSIKQPLPDSEAGRRAAAQMRLLRMQAREAARRARG